LDRDIVAEAGAANAASLLPLVLGVGLAVGGGWVGTSLRSAMGEGPGRRADALGGALTGLLACVLVVWLVAGWVRTTPMVGPNAAVAESRIVGALDRMAPVSSAEALGAIA